MSSISPSKPAYRCTLRFSLRTAALVIIVLQLPLAWYFYARNKATREQMAAERIVASGTGRFHRGPVEYSPRNNDFRIGDKSPLQISFERFGADRLFFPV